MIKIYKIITIILLVLMICRHSIAENDVDFLNQLCTLNLE